MDKNLLKNHLNNLKEELDSCRYAINKYSKYNIVEPNKETINELYNKRLKLSVELSKIKTELDKVNEEIGIEVKESSAIQIFTDTPSWYDRVDGIMLTKETLFFIDSYKGEPYNKEPNKHEEMVWVTPEEVFSNPKLYTYI